MVNRRTASRAAADDDQAVASVVGFVLILAAVVSYAWYAAQSEVPRAGAMRERAWDDEVGVALAGLASGAAAGAAGDAGVSRVVPAAPDPPGGFVPFVRPLLALEATGTIAFDPRCGGATLTHAAGGATIVDLRTEPGTPAASAAGCITFRGETAYAEPFAYRMELGGVLRIQGDRAFVVAGPPLEASPGRVAITLVNLSGLAQSLGADASAAITLSPRAGAPEALASANADNATWRFSTDYPEAWSGWYAERFQSAGVRAEVGFSCSDPSLAGPARGPCEVAVRIPDPASLSVSYARYHVSVG